MENIGNNVPQQQQLNSQQSGHSGKTGVVSSPWSHVVRGESESNSVAPLSPPAAITSPTAVSEQVVGSASSSSTTEDEICNGNAGKRPAWNVQSNGAVEIGPVMGAVSWPALSESARVSSKPSPLDGSSSSVPVSGDGTASSSPPKQVNNNAAPNSSPYHTAPQRLRSIKQRNGAFSSDGSSQPLVVSQGHAGEVHHSNSPSPRDHAQRSSQSRSSSENHSGQQRSSFRSRNGGGPHSRADGSYSHHSYGGGRRAQDRGNQDWNTHNRSFNGRDGHVQQPQRVAPRFMRHPPPPPPPTSTPFMTPAPVRPFGAPMVFPELAPPLYYVTGASPQSLRGMPFVSGQIQPHAMFFPPPDFQLHSKIVTQIDYYFSNENLIRDTYLRHNMDEQGWVPINLIAGFNKVSDLTNDIQLILEALRSSTVVEVQGRKVRRRNDWMRWLMPPSVQFPSAPSPQGLGMSNQEMLVGNLQNMSLREVSGQSSVRHQANIQPEASQSKSSSGDFSCQPQPSSSNERSTSQLGVHEGLDHFTSAKN